MRRLAVLAMLALVCAARPSPASAEGEARARLQLLARSLVSDYQARRPGAPRQALAVFDFACPDRLAKQRVGYAVAELLKPTLLAATEFTVVERSDLQKVLGEQALQQTGVVDQNTGVQLGKLVGAKLVLTGNVDKLGASYQVSARLVDVATSELISAAVQEFPAKDFEEDAQPYLNLVPEEQAIGIFACGGYDLLTGYDGAGDLALHRAPAVSETADLVAANAFDAEFGVRYLAAPWLLLEAGYQPMQYNERVETSLSSPAAGTSPGSNAATQEADFHASGFEAQALYVRRLAPRFRLLGGVGVKLMSFDSSQNGGQGPNISVVSGAGSYQAGTMALLTDKPNPTIVRPLLRVGAEWMVMSRLGWSLSALVFPVPSHLEIHAEVGGPTGMTDYGRLATFTLPTLEITNSFALYF